MKKIIFTSLISVIYSTESIGQNFYNFTKSTAPYTELTNAISLNNNIVWNIENIPPVSTPFPIYVFGQNFSVFGFIEFTFKLGNPITLTEANLVPITADISDRNFTGTGASASPISYKVEGTTGNRILKLQLKNAGLEADKTIGNGSSVHFLNYQIWFYEADNSIEYRYGANNITNLNLLNEEGFLLAGLSIDNDTSGQIGYINGSVVNPVYNESFDIEIFPTTMLSGIPAANTVHKFTPNPLSVKDLVKVDFSLYPNPATDVLNITLKENIDVSYSVYDMQGRELLKGDVDSENISINTNNLSTGTYLLRIGSSTQKFQKK